MYDNYIVNVLYTAEIEKCTHRPIMHMFDMIVCQNSSALLGAALAISKRAERESNYGLKFMMPEFTACEFIRNSQEIFGEFRA